MNFKRIRITKTLYLKGFAIIVILLALVRCVFPSVATGGNSDDALAKSTAKEAEVAVSQHQEQEEVAQPVVVEEKQDAKATLAPAPATEKRSNRYYDKDGQLIKNRILSVANYHDAFPDLQDVQIMAANKFGVKPVMNREEAERRKMELVYVGANPYFYVQPLQRSIPYLVPRAAVLLQDIGRNFFDSLQMKGVPLHKINVTSLMRSKADVGKLRNYNGNATENSCHLYGTTFDISYNRYVTVQEPNGPRRREVRNDTLKWVLCEVLRDLREQSRCYVKYEVKQGCFHITTR